MDFNLEAADYHRNGVGGSGFYVAVFTSRDFGPGRFLAVVFPEYSKDGELLPRSPRTAVLELGEAADGNVFMHQQLAEDGQFVPRTGGNAWRGADSFPDLPAVLEAEVSARFERDRKLWAKRRASQRIS